MATRPVLTDNTVAGCERMGFYTDGEPCTTEINPTEPWSNNVAHSSLTGVMLLKVSNSDTVGHEGCTMVGNFTTYKNHDYGVYYQLKSSVQLIGVTSIDNGVGFFSLVFAPPAVSHVAEEKFVHIFDSSFVGTSSALTNDLWAFTISKKLR